MRKILLVSAFALVMLFAVRDASAQSACCAEKPCVDQNGDGTCDNPNGGKQCDMASAGEAPGSAGCVEAPTGTCAGGDASAAEGCICAANGACFGGSGPVTAEQCRDAAVDACCAGGACS